MTEERHVRLHAFLRPVQLQRQMKFDAVPVLLDGGSSDERREVLSLLYREICSSWRELVGVRFKLLGLVPAVSAIGLGTVLNLERLETVVGIGVSTFGSW